MLAKSPQQRVATPAEVAEALTSLASADLSGLLACTEGQAVAIAVSDVRLADRPAEHRRFRLCLAAAGAAMLALAVGLIWIAVRPEAESGALSPPCSIGSPQPPARPKPCPDGSC